MQRISAPFRAVQWCDATRFAGPGLGAKAAWLSHPFRRVAAAAAGTLLFAIAGSFVMHSHAGAQDAYPSRPITIVVPFPPGGSTDVIGRVVAEGLRKILGVPVVVDNRSGAGGMLGTAGVARSQPDGYTIGMGTASTLAINPAVYKSPGYDVLNDLAPISLISAVPNIITVNADLPVKSIEELIQLARSQPGKLAYASAGVGSVSHLMGEQFKLATKTDILHVPYRGVGPALNDTIGGQVQIMFDNLPTSLPLVQSGKLRALAVSSPKRLDVLPDVPTFAELKLTELDWMAFFGLIAPSGVPSALIDRLNKATAQVLSQPDVREKLATQQALVVGGSSERFKDEISREFERQRRAVQAAGIKME